MKNLLKVIGLAVSISTAFSPQSALAENYDDAFASPVNLRQNDFGNYYVEFIRAKNSYSYQIQVAGKNLFGGLVCNRFGAREIRTSEWKNVKAQLGIGISLDDASVNTNIYGENEIVPIYGGFVGRIPVQKARHIRVVAINENGQEVYKTNWLGGNDIISWGWDGDCAWVAN
ncbi:MAG: hypothetical protein AAF349_09955 [Cyanobacteria bacterium P01_A01_bin.68]